MAEQHSSIPPSLPPKESQTRRFKPIWRLLLVFNLALGAYMFAGPRKKDANVESNHKKSAEKRVKESKADEEVDFFDIEAMPIYETPTPPPPALELVKVCEPIPEDQRRELFKWMLQEKRKIKPKDLEQKRCIDQEKAILKQFIRAKTIPKL